jgi:hypothetical protein
MPEVNTYTVPSPPDGRAAATRGKHAVYGGKASA